MNKNHLIIALGFILAGILCIVFKGAIINWLILKKWVSLRL